MANLERQNSEGQFVGRDKEKKKADAHYQFLKTCLYYLEQVTPTEQMLKDSVARDEKEIEEIEKGFEAWKLWNMAACSKHGLKVEAYYHKEMN